MMLGLIPDEIMTIIGLMRSHFAIEAFNNLHLEFAIMLLVVTNMKQGLD